MTILSIGDLIGKLRHEDGKYKKLHYRTSFQGIPISIENRKGSHRYWHDKRSGETGRTKMEMPYGYIRGVQGADGDELDCFIGPDEDSDTVFVVNQRSNVDFRRFDEHKVLFGFSTVAKAKKAYLRHYDERGEKFIGGITVMGMKRFRKWLKNGAKDKPVRKGISNQSPVRSNLRPTRKLVLSPPAEFSSPRNFIKAGPFIGPKGGKWADAKHTIPWKAAAKTASSGGPIHPFWVVDKTGQRGFKSRAEAEAHRDRQVSVKHVGDEAKHPYWVTSHTTGNSRGFKTREAAEAHRDSHFRVKAVKSMRAPRLILRKAKGAKHPTGGGWMPMPKSKKSGWKKMRGKKVVDTWYPGQDLHPHHHAHAEEPKAEGHWTEAQFKAKKFDTDPYNWEWSDPPQSLARGAVDADSAHPVKLEGTHAKLFRIVKKEIPGQSGWAQVIDLATGHKQAAAHDRIVAITYISEAERTKRAAIKREREAAPTGPSVPRRSYSLKPRKWDESVGKSMPKGDWDSKHKQGTALWRIENGGYRWKMVKRTEISEEAKRQGKKAKRITTHEPGMSQSDKQEVIAKFGGITKGKKKSGLIPSQAAKTMKSFGLKARYTTDPLSGKRVNETLRDLQMAGVEGVLRALQSYGTKDGKPRDDLPGPIVPRIQRYVKDYMRLHAAQEFAGGIGMDRRRARMLQSYIAARAEASRVLKVDSPTPAEAAEFWKLKKVHLHDYMTGSEGQQPVGNNHYSISASEDAVEHVVEEDERGRKMVVQKPTKKKTKVDKKYPGKLHWAEEMEGFLSGQKGVEWYDDSIAMFPEKGIGIGVNPIERIEVNQRLTQALEGEGEVSVGIGGEGRKKASIHVVDAKEIMSRALGLHPSALGTPQTIAEIARAVTVARVKADGSRKVAGFTRSQEVVKQALEDALGRAQGRLKQRGDRDAAFIAGRIKETAFPREEVPMGPTMSQKLREDMAKVDKRQVRRWRQREAGRLKRIADRMTERAHGMRDSYEKPNALLRAQGAQNAAARVGEITDNEVRRRIAMHRIMSAPMSEEMQEAMTHTVSVDAIHSPHVEHGWKVYTKVDPITGNEKRVRVRTFSDVRDTTYKSLDPRRPMELTAGMLHELSRFPLTMELLWAPDDVLADAPTEARSALDRLLGFA